MVSPLIRPFVKPITLSLAKPVLADLLGMQQPSAFTKGVVQAAMRVRKLLLRHFTIWDVLDFEKVVRGNFKTYPNGYDPMQLGPTKLIKIMERERQSDHAGSVM